jgi:heme/copper-type cytochrome/quinol oxidase subunit 4
LKNIRESDLIEKEYSKRGGVVLIILGVIVIVLVIWIGLVLEPISGQGWDVIGWVFGIPFGIILMVIGITLVLYNNYKLSKLEAQKLN